MYASQTHSLSNGVMSVQDDVKPRVKHHEWYSRASFDLQWGIRPVIRYRGGYDRSFFFHTFRFMSVAQHLMIQTDEIYDSKESLAEKKLDREYSKSLCMYRHERVV